MEIALANKISMIRGNIPNLEDVTLNLVEQPKRSRTKNNPEQDENYGMENKFRQMLQFIYDFARSVMIF